MEPTEAHRREALALLQGGTYATDVDAVAGALAAKDAEIAELRAGIRRLFTAYSGTLVRVPLDHACRECVTGHNLHDDMVRDGFRCPYHTLAPSAE